MSGTRAAARPRTGGFGVHPGKRSLVALNVLGGSAVLLSYAVGLPSVGDALWGGIPDAARPVYTVNMFLAAAGYFLFTPYIVFRLAPDSIRWGGSLGYGVFHLLYALILIPSAVWLPLTAHVIAEPGLPAWWGLRVGLALTGLGSLGLLGILLRLPAGAPPGRGWAVLGLLPFVFQTAVLDALVWPAYFPFPTP